MVSFGEQLRILLWKNWTLRKRNKKRLFIEILWPLTLFLILMWVRTRGLKYNEKSCHVIEKALPSVGGFEFFQNFICTLNNTCYPDEVENTDTTRWDGALIVKFVKETAPILTDILSTNKSRETVVQVWSDLMNYMKIISNFQNAEDLKKLGTVKLVDLINPQGLESFREAAQTYTQLDAELLDEFLKISVSLENLNRENVDAVITDLQNDACDYNKKYELLTFPTPKSLQDLCSLSREKKYMLLFVYSNFLDRNGFQRLNSVIESEETLTEAESTAPLRALMYDFKTIEKLGELGRKIMEMGKVLSNFGNLTGAEIASVFIYEGVCGIKQNTKNITLFEVNEGRPRTYDSLRDRLKDWNPDHVYEIDNEISPACNAIFSRMEAMPISSFMWRQVKPIVRGSIYYAPENEMTRMIMQKVDEKFSNLQNLEVSVNSILQIMHRVRMWMHSHMEELKNVKTFLSKRSNIEGILKLLGMQTQGKQVDRIYEFSASLNTLNLEPSLERLDFITEVLSEIIGCVKYNKTKGFLTEWEAVNAGHELLSAEKLWAVVIFSNIQGENDTEFGNATLPSHVYYKIRMDSDKVDGTRAVKDRLTSKGPRRRPLFDLKYITYGFVYLQEMIERSIIEIITGEDLSKEEVYLQQYPYPCYIFDQFIRAISRTFPLFMVLSWVYASAMIIKSVVLEKERRLKEVMKIMGVSNLAIWTSWFIESFIIMLVSSSVLTVILKYGKVMEFSNPLLIWIFLICYTVSTICFSFLVSTFFSRANSAAAAGGVIFFISYLPYNMMMIWEEQLEWFETLMGCLVSNVAFGFGCTYFARFEQDGIGAQWETLTWQSLPQDEFNLIYCMCMLIFDSFLYIFLTWYIEAVFPGQYGVPKPWNFFCKGSYWFNSKPKYHKANAPDDGTDTADGSTVTVRIFDSGGDRHLENIEIGPEGAECGVQIRHLTKIYSNGKVALDNLSMTFYENQITSFLGHNGAGKTTTISILTGLFPPSKGTAIVNGLDIRKDMDTIRQNLGICPQFNVLFDRLNVYEHLKFYALLKGKKGPEVEKEFDEMLQDLGIPHKRRSYPNSLSGGMKRKLSVAIAFVGGSKTVFLDEPTSGVDPYSRRSIWELLLKYKTGRTVILTTHFMDEADILGDRIAIISQGKLKALGSSLFLKSHFGQGYTLHLVKTENFRAESGQVENFKASRISLLKHDELIEKFVHSIIPYAIVTENVGSEIAFLLPYADIDKFSDLFASLNKNLESLGILSFGISDTSLEDVFLKITMDDLSTNLQSFHNLSSCCKRRFEKILNRCRNRKDNEVGTILPARDPSASTNITTVTDDATTLSSLQPNCVNFSKYDDVNAEESDTTTIKVHSAAADGKLAHSKYREATNGDLTTVTTSLLTESVVEEEFTPESSKLTRFLNKCFSCMFSCSACPCIIQVYMIIWKRFKNCMRNKKAMFFEIILPALFIAITLAFTLILPPAENERPREVTPWVYESPNNIFFAEPNVTRKRGVPQEFKTFLNELIGPIGMGTACLADQHRKLCHKTKWKNESVQVFNTTRLNFKGVKFAPCNCDIGTMRCPKDNKNSLFPKLKTQTNDYIWDVSNTDIPEWILRNYDKYLNSKYGGFELQLRKSNSILGYLTLLENLTNLLPLPKLENPDGRGIIENPSIEESKGLTSTVKRRYTYKIWYENRGWLSSIAYLNALHNTWLRGKLPDEYKEQKDRFGITLTTHPMNLTKSQSSKENLKTAGLGVIHAICIIFALSFIPASFTVYLIEERKCGGKHLHLVSGVHPITYWIANFIYDMFKYLIPTALCLILFAAFDAQAYIGPPNLLPFVCLLLLYGWASIPSMYPFSFMFGVPSTAFVVLACSNLFIGVVTTVSTFVLEQFGDEELEAIGRVLKKVFLVFPHYCLGRGCITLVRLHIEETALTTFLRNSQKTADRFEWNHLGEKLAYLAVHGIAYFLFTLMVEYRYLPVLLCKRKKMPTPYDEDIDVTKERERVANSDGSDMTLAAIDLTRYYSKGKCGNAGGFSKCSKEFPAVNGLTFGIGKGECFGLLGVNGAGKSSTFKMLTGDIRISSGSAKICGASVETQLDKARKHFGYCPQEDSIDPLLSGYELLYLYGRLRGLSAIATDEAARRLIKTLGLSRYANRSCGTYSGGNKRKLSTGIALIGDPDVIFLDEPTSGMDPGARRDLWKVILDLLYKGKTVVLTSHSMEECEVLCTKIAIMVNGEFKCLGSLQHLKNRFGKGYTLTIRCVEGHQDTLLKSIRDDIPMATIEDEHCLQIKLNISQESAKLGDIFSTLSRFKTEEIIEDYSVSQTTLDDIFVRFASQQKDSMDETPVKLDNILSCTRGRRT